MNSKNFANADAVVFRGIRRGWASSRHRHCAPTLREFTQTRVALNV